MVDAVTVGLAPNQLRLLATEHAGCGGEYRRKTGRYGDFVCCNKCGRKVLKPRGATAASSTISVATDTVTTGRQLTMEELEKMTAPKRVTVKVTPTMGVHDMLAAICPNLGVPGPHRILLWGPPGTAKSSGPGAWWPEKQVERVALTEDSAPEDLMGYYTLKGMDTQYAEGPATRALRHGRPLVLDEIDRTSSSIVSLLHALLDDVKIAEVTLPTGETIRPNDGYAVIATTNQSPQALHDALLDRF